MALGEVETGPTARIGIATRLSEANIGRALKQTFQAKYCTRGLWEWEVESDPIRAEDGSQRLFVWARPVRWIKGGNRRGRMPKLVVWFLPRP